MSVRRSGILLIDKPAGMSSARVVAKVKRALCADRVGHAGTLDPDATGLLIILVNGATRVASYAADGWKVYSGGIKLGVRTSTDDLSGEVLSTHPCAFDFESICRAASSLTGRVLQLPPKVSAKKIDGKRAYKLHRSGHDFELQPREVEVQRFEIFPTDASDSIRYIAEVSPGTYVRALARDLGDLLGCGAAVSTIRRDVSGYFSVDNSVSIEDVSWSHLRDWSELVPSMTKVLLSQSTIMGLLNGQQHALHNAWREANSIELKQSHVVYCCRESGESIGILKVLPEGAFAFGLNIGK